MNRPLRLAVLRTDAAAADWVAGLARPSLELVRVDDVDGLVAAGADYGLVCVEHTALPSLADQIAARPAVPPVTILSGPPSVEHPHARLLKTLLQGKREWEASFDAIPDPLALLAADGSVLRANRAFARVLARDFSAVIGQPFGQLVGSVATGTPDPVAESLKDDQPRQAEARYAQLAGVYLVTTAPLAGNGDSSGLVVLLHDLTEHKEEQVRLLKAARLADIGQLAAGVAHEINTPLASIALRAESLLRHVEDPRLTAVESFRNFPRYLKTIEEETFRCKKIIAALLEFSSGRKLDARPVDLNLLAERAADLVGHQMRLKQVALQVRLEPDLLPVAVDDGQLRQVLIALLMNALDATAAGGHIAIETRRAGADSVAFAVVDDGVGIAPEVRDKIFSPFFTTKPVGQGTGLGLAICHGIVTAHGGQIQVDSELGKGTRIAVTLPIGPAQEAAATAPGGGAA